MSTQVTPVVQEEPSSPKKTLRFSVAPSPVQNEAAKKLRFSVAPSPKKRVSILEEKEETLSAVDFQAIMGFLLNFVDKEKHAEALAEKLCQRIDGTKADDDAFAKANDVQTASRRDLAFCLGRLMLTEKVTRKLAESIALYKDALPDEGVYAAFTAIVQKARKLPKVDALKELLDDWEAKLLAGHERRLDLDGAGPTAPPPSAKKKKAPAKKRATRKKKVVQSDSDDEGGDALAENVPRATRTRPRRGVRA